MHIHRESKKGDTILLTDFHNSFTNTFSRKFAIKLLIDIPTHIKCVATLPCEMLKAEKLTII